MTNDIGKNGHAAVLCAFHNGNAGMFSVDLAAHHFLDEAGITYDLFVGQTDSVNAQHKYGGLTFDVCRDQGDLSNYSHIIYWGDFLNNPIYGKVEFSYQDVGLKRSSDRPSAYQVWKNIMLPDRSKLGDKKVISVSNNFQGMDRKITADEADELRDKFTTGFDAIFPRDPFGMDSLTSIFPSAANGNVQQGIDAAFLWDPRRDFDLSTDKSGSYFSYHFGRSKLRNEDALLRAISRATGLSARPLDGWLACRPRPRDMMEKFLRQMSGSRFVISDTYHCCVNAMNISTPVIGLGKEVAEQLGTLGDYKKFVLFDMFNMSHRYFGIAKDDITASEMERVISTALELSCDGVRDSEFYTLRAKRAIYIEALRSALLTSNSQ